MTGTVARGDFRFGRSAPSSPTVPVAQWARSPVRPLPPLEPLGRVVTEVLFVIDRYAGPGDPRVDRLATYLADQGYGSYLELVEHVEWATSPRWAWFANLGVLRDDPHPFYREEPLP